MSVMQGHHRCYTVLCVCVRVQTIFQSVTNGKEQFSRLLFCRLKSDCRWTLGTESVRILESTAQDPATTLMAISSPYHKALCTCLFLKTMNVRSVFNVRLFFFFLFFLCDVRGLLSKKISVE